MIFNIIISFCVSFCISMSATFLCLCILGQKKKIEKLRVSFKKSEAKLKLIEGVLKARDVGHHVPLEIPYDKKRDERLYAALRNSAQNAPQWEDYFCSCLTLGDDVKEGKWMLQSICLWDTTAEYSFYTFSGKSLDFKIEMKFEEFRCDPNYRG